MRKTLLQNYGPAFLVFTLEEGRAVEQAWLRPTKFGSDRVYQAYHKYNFGVDFFQIDSIYGTPLRYFISFSLWQ